jgi:hypothetical protein
MPQIGGLLADFKTINNFGEMGGSSRHIFQEIL